MYDKPVIERKRGKYATDNAYRETKLCNIPRLKLSCFGCCGQDYGSKEQILRRILRNTKELKRYKDLIEFRDRVQEVSACGLCTNVVFKDEKKSGAHCPLHPNLNKGKDLREGYCQIDHLCKSAQKFKEWDKDLQKKFLKFMEKKVKEGMDWYDYSRAMDNDKLLKEFLKLNAQS